MSMVMRSIEEHIGARFGMLTVLEDLGLQDRRRVAKVQCDCGTVKPMRLDAIKRGSALSCGCQRGPGATHGHARPGGQSKAYKSWLCMKQRVLNPKNGSYHNYGGRGIRIDERWMEFSNFLLDMGEPPPGHTLDREDTNGNYCKSNCKWSTKAEQAKNRRTSIFLEYGGKRMTKTDWAREIGVTVFALNHRLAAGWTLEQALTTPNTRHKAAEASQ